MEHRRFATLQLEYLSNTQSDTRIQSDSTRLPIARLALMCKAKPKLIIYAVDTETINPAALKKENRDKLLMDGLRTALNDAIAMIIHHPILQKLRELQICLHRATTLSPLLSLPQARE